MTSVYNVENKPSKSSEVILPLFGVLLKSTAEQEIQGLGESVNMDHSERLEEVPFLSLAHEKHWDRSNDVENEVEGYVIVCNLRQFFMSSCLLNEVKNDLDKVDDIYSQLKLFKCTVFIHCSFSSSWIIASYIDIYISIFSRYCGQTVFINVLKHQDERSHEQSVNCHDGDQEIPNFAKRSLCIDQIPL